MRLLLSVAHGPDSRLVDVAVTCEETATVADLASHLAHVVAPAAPPAARVRDTGRRLGVVVDAADDDGPAPETFPAVAALATTTAPLLHLGQRPLDPGQLLADSPVRNGAILGLDAPAAATTDEPAGVVEIRVVSGPGAGAVRRLGIGTHRIGPGVDASVHLPHGPAVNVDVAPDGTVRIHPPADPGDAVPAPMRREPLDGPIVVPRRDAQAQPATRGRARPREPQALDARFLTIDPAADRAVVEARPRLADGRHGVGAGTVPERGDQPARAAPAHPARRLAEP